MSAGELDIAKREIEIYEKELLEAVMAHESFTARALKELEGKNLSESLAIFATEYGQKQALYRRVVDLMGKVISAYKTYTALLERNVGK